MEDDPDFAALAALVEAPGEADHPGGGGDLGNDFAVAEAVLGRAANAEAPLLPQAPSGFAQRSPALLAFARERKATAKLASENQVLKERLEALGSRCAQCPG